MLLADFSHSATPRFFELDGVERATQRRFTFLLNLIFEFVIELEIFLRRVTPSFSWKCIVLRELHRDVSLF